MFGGMIGVKLIILESNSIYLRSYDQAKGILQNFSADFGHLQRPLTYCKEFIKQYRNQCKTISKLFAPKYVQYILSSINIVVDHK